MSEMELYRALGRAVAKRRNELKLTQAFVAERIGLTRASLANIETGRQKLLLHQVYRLANVLQLGSILDLAPASFTVEAEQGGKPRDDALPVDPKKVTQTQKRQIEDAVRQALASERPPRKVKA